ncbi:MAG: succinate--CoA ligase subunit alpha [Bacilli bacterium]|nr:succinate--CoA ligase subunit alpha [Bacilli bacterium]
MSILVDNNTRVIVQGITGKSGSFHTEQMIKYGTNIVGGVTPNKGGTFVFDTIPVFDTVKEAKEKTKANASIIFVPPRFAKDSILEAIDAEIELVVCITEGIPALDMLEVRKYLKNKKTRLVGPNCPGLISPDKCKLGIMPGFIHKPGHIGVISRSGTLTYEVVNQLSTLNVGQSTAIGIGGDSLRGTTFIDALTLFNNDEDTYGIIMIGEIGGSGEEEAAAWIKANCKKPIVSFIAGSTAPKGKRMGHAGAIISGGHGTASGKKQALREAGVRVCETPDVIGKTMYELLEEKGILESCKCK